MSENDKIAHAIAAIIVIIFFPMLAIWAVNTLFGFEIVLSWSTWFAALVLISCFRSGNGSNNK